MRSTHLELLHSVKLVLYGYLLSIYQRNVFNDMTFEHHKITEHSNRIPYLSCCL